MLNTPKLVIASRGSALALAQAHFILELCQSKMPYWNFEIKVIKTTGDKLQTASLANPDKSLPKGLFTKEIEEALLSGEADLAVHSLKDLPTELPDGLKLGAVPDRHDARDVLVVKSENYQSVKASLWDSIPDKAIIASSSLRRKSQIVQNRKDIEVVEIRGNVGTRLKKLRESENLYGTVLACAGIERLGMVIGDDGALSGEGVPEGLSCLIFSQEDMLPCVGQAALGIEIRDNDPLLDELCVMINDAVAWYETHAERAFLRHLGGGCQSPIAAHGQYLDGTMMLNAYAELESGLFRGHESGSLCDAESLGIKLAERARQ